MLTNITNTFFNQLQIPGITTTIALVDKGSGGAFGGGVLSAASHVIWLIFIGMMIVWIALSIFGAFKITRSAGDPQETEKGMTIIKNIWIGVSSFMLFAMVLSVLGAFMGFGNISEWGDNLAQCGPDMDFYFVEVENKTIIEEQDPAHIIGTYNVYCCQTATMLFGAQIDAGWHIVPKLYANPAYVPSQCILQNTIEIE